MPRVEYFGPRKGTFHVPGGEGREYSFSANESRKIQDVHSDDLPRLLERTDFRLVREEAPSQAPKPLLPQPTIVMAPPPRAADTRPPSERTRELRSAQELAEFEKAVEKVAPPEIKVIDFTKSLGISTKAAQAMYQAGLNTIADVALATDDELLAIKGVGPTTLRRIRVKLGDEWS